MQINGQSIQKVYCVGIGGVGVGPLAACLQQMGIQVTGADTHRNALTAQLEEMGVTIHHQHLAEQLQDADVLVYSSAVSENNPERTAARQRGIPELQRAEMLAEILKKRSSIAVAGTHGKTTTTAMLGHLLQQAGTDPSYLIGGLLQNSNSYMRWGEGQWLVVEADESDGTLIHLQPDYAILSNVEADHLVNFEDDFEQLQQSFLRFLRQVHPDGFVVVNADDPIAMALLERVGRTAITVGVSQDSMFRLSGFRQEGLNSYFDLSIEGAPAVSVSVPMPGLHNAYNAAMALACAHRLGLDLEVLIEALADFGGVGRRFSVCGKYQFDQNTVTLINDYGHHPTEIAATIKAAREAYPNQRIVLVFEPHRFSRTQALFEQFLNALSLADGLFLVDTYSAGEDSVASADSTSLYAALRCRDLQQLEYIGKLNCLPEMLKTHARPDDVVILQGAGSIGYLPEQWAQYCCV